MSIRRQRQTSVLAEKLAFLKTEMEKHEKDLAFQQSQMESASKRTSDQRKRLAEHQNALQKFDKECRQKSESGLWITGSEHEKLYNSRMKIERNIEAASAALEIATETYQTEKENRIANMRRIAQIKASMTTLQQDMDRLSAGMRKNILAQCIDELRKGRKRNVEPIQSRLYL
ncbi:hypothetical protein VKS41_000114 [Umbelopsis sp. WA50703]|jgi:hypothetical protein